MGRVTEIAGKRWKVDLNARRDAALLLSAVNLPGGIQRRRTAEDELNMRAVYEEGDLISAEVQSLHADSSIILHTRSSKFGKLSAGQLITVPANLIKRQKQHFHSLESIGVDLIIGCNGMVWIANFGGLTTGTLEDAPKAVAPLTVQDHEHISRAASIVRALSKLRLSITAASIQSACQAAVEGGHATWSLQDHAFLDVILRQEADRRIQ